MIIETLNANSTLDTIAMTDTVGGGCWKLRRRYGGWKRQNHCFYRRFHCGGFKRRPLAGGIFT